jgi:hypothetical protein
MNLSDFLDDLMPRLSGAEERLILHETLSTVRRLCEEGWAWPLDFGPISVKEGKSLVYLDPMPCNTRVGYVLSAAFAASGPVTRPLAPATARPVIDSMKRATPSAFYMQDTGTLQLVPTPDKDYDNALSLVCTVIPTCVDTVIPDFFGTHFRDAVIDGVCARMMVMNSKPWSNGPLASLHGKSFKNHIKRTRDITKRRYSLGDRNWSYPRTFV